MALDDTIVALSSTAAAAGRIVLRVSGPRDRELAEQLSITFPAAHSNVFQAILSLEPYLEVGVWIYHFRGPASYTGQDIVELHVPGNPLLAQLTLKRLIALGARAAEPGEFTARAFFNGRIDLAQAEGIAATIEAQNQCELAAARRLLSGELAMRLRPAMDKLADMLALVEVGIDFSEEDVKFLHEDVVRRRIEDIRRDLSSLKDQSPRMARLSHEPSFVLAGRPNAGKSTLLNALAGYARAIVSPIAGTTRDALSAEIRLKRGPAKVIDVAGLDTADSSHSIDVQMQSHAARMIEEADHLILLHDSSDTRPLLNLSRQPSLIVYTKSDLQKKPVRFSISAVTGIGLDTLLEKLDSLAFGEHTPTDSLALTARHLHHIDESLDALSRASEESATEELLALELREALDALGQILGNISPDDILGQIFGRFCIGK